jgi:hypothetical protein
MQSGSNHDFPNGIFTDFEPISFYLPLPGQRWSKSDQQISLEIVRE